VTRSLLVVVATLVAGVANATVPVFSAACASGINVDADRTGVVRINGAKAKVKNLNDSSGALQAGDERYVIPER